MFDIVQVLESGNTKDVHKRTVALRNNAYRRTATCQDLGIDEILSEVAIAQLRAYRLAAIMIGSMGGIFHE